MLGNASVLFTPFDLKGLRLGNRIVMAPLTRSRAGKGDVPGELNAVYYAQRASAGLVIAEATQISPQGKGYAFTPGIHSDEQVAGWKQVTEAVHRRGGRIFLQLWHVGRISHPSIQPDGQAPVAPSAIAPRGQRTYNEHGFVDILTPRALETREIPGIVEDFRKAARHAKAAGFDGVEIHGANGYLLDEFLRDGANRRTDAYGGSIANRIRLPVDVAEAVAGEWGPERVGIRLSPVARLHDLSDSHPQPVFNALVRELDRLGLGYIHVVEGTTQGPRDFDGFDFRELRRLFRGAWMVNNGYDRAMAAEAVITGYADLVAFGRPYIANPDLVERLRRGAPLTEADKATLYGGDAGGYTDYPPLR